MSKRNITSSVAEAIRLALPNDLTPSMAKKAAIAVEGIVMETLRDRLAGQALAGFCAQSPGLLRPIDYDRVPQECYRLADAMLVERAKEAPDGE